MLRPRPAAGFGAAAAPRGEAGEIPGLDRARDQAIGLLGALDEEAPAYFCTRKADRLKARGQPLRYKVYPETTHSFDSERWGTKGRYIRHGERGPFLYRYSPEATEDAWREVKALFDQTLKGH